MRILVADDDPTLRELVTVLLESRGYEVRTVGDGKEAVSLAHSYRPDLLLLDIMLPGMTGFEVCEAVRKDDSLRGMKIIMISAKGFATDMKAAQRLGADHYLMKPFENTDLFEAVKSFEAPPARSPDPGAPRP